MALQDNFNAIYNKKEQARAQREEEKQADLSIELQLKEELLTAFLDYAETHEPIYLYNISVKHKIINEIITSGEIYTAKYSKYKNTRNIQNYLSKNYDSILNKSFKIIKLYNEKREAEEQARAQKILQEASEQQQETPAPTKKKDNNFWGDLALILFLIIAAPVAFCWRIVRRWN